MLRHGGAPIWTALTVETGEITGISVPTGKVGPGPIRSLKLAFTTVTEVSPTFLQWPRFSDFDCTQIWDIPGPVVRERERERELY